MFDKYKKFFDTYLELCKSKYNVENPNLEECCVACDCLRYELLGMLELLESVQEITPEEKKIEATEVISTFSTSKLFNAYMINGDVYVYKERN